MVGVVTVHFDLSWPMLAFLWSMVFLGGFLDSAAGGGGLISLPAYLFTGMPTYVAFSSNKFSGACGTTFAAVRFFANGALDLRVALIAAVGSLIGSAVASRIVLFIDEGLLKAALAVAIPIAAVIVMCKRNYGEIDRSSELGTKSALSLSLLIGTMIGAYDGMIGPGTGTFAIMAFAALMKYDLKTASGNAKVLNMASNYGSIVVFALAGTIDYTIALPAGLFGILGSYLGSGYAIKKGAKFIRPAMMVVMVLLLGKVLFDLL